MTHFPILAVLVALTALFSYLNSRFIRLPATIGVRLIAMVPGKQAMICCSDLERNPPK